jgi:hypothetical protein
MREVDQSTLIVPDVLATHDDIVADSDWDALADVDIVRHEHGLRCAREADDETLVRSGWPGVI